MLRRLSALCAAVILCSPGAIASAAPSTPDGKDAVLKASDITPKLFPETVFFRGQSAPVQMRNTGGLHFYDDFYVLAGLVDNSGYSTGIREKYQAYFLTEVNLEIGGQKLNPSAYRIRFFLGRKLRGNGPGCE